MGLLCGTARNSWNTNNTGIRLLKPLVYFDIHSSVITRVYSDHFFMMCVQMWMNVCLPMVAALKTASTSREATSVPVEKGLSCWGMAGVALIRTNVQQASAATHASTSVVASAVPAQRALPSGKTC